MSIRVKLFGLIILFCISVLSTYGFEREYTLQMGLTETIEYYEESLRSKQ